MVQYVPRALPVICGLIIANIQIASAQVATGKGIQLAYNQPVIRQVPQASDNRYFTEIELVRTNSGPFLTSTPARSEGGISSSQFFSPITYASRVGVPAETVCKVETLY